MSATPLHAPTPAPLPSEARAPATRFAGLDGLRAASMLFIILWHSALAYGAQSSSMWGVRDASAGETWDRVIWFSMGVTLRIFFVMSGFFACFVYERRGLRFFASHRLRRIGGPLLVGGVLFHFLVHRELGYFPFHLWFLQHLLAVSLALATFVFLADRYRGGIDPAPVGRLAERACTWLVAPALLAVPTGVVLYLAGGIGNDPSALANDLGLDPWKLAYYAMFFCFGWFLYRHQDVLVTFEKRFVAYLVFGFALRLATVFLLDLEPSAPRTLAMLGLTATYTWSMVFGSIGCFSRLLQQDRPALRYVADMSYWWYFAHPIPVFALHVALRDVAAPTPIKYVLVLTTTIVVLALSYEFVVRYTPIGSALNGPRRRPAGSRWSALSLRPFSASTSQ